MHALRSWGASWGASMPPRGLSNTAVPRLLIGGRNLGAHMCPTRLGGAVVWQKGRLGCQAVDSEASGPRTELACATWYTTALTALRPRVVPLRCSPGERGGSEASGPLLG